MILLNQIDFDTISLLRLDKACFDGVYEETKMKIQGKKDTH